MPQSMVVIRCIQAFDKYKEGVPYVVKADVAEALVNVFPSCFEYEDAPEDAYEVSDVD